jgi:hypothetical protein
MTTNRVSRRHVLVNASAVAVALDLPATAWGAALGPTDSIDAKLALYDQETQAEVYKLVHLFLDAIGPPPASISDFRSRTAGDTALPHSHARVPIRCSPPSSDTVGRRRPGNNTMTRSPR